MAGSTTNLVLSTTRVTLSSPPRMFELHDGAVEFLVFGFCKEERDLKLKRLAFGKFRPR